MASSALLLRDAVCREPEATLLELDDHDGATLAGA
jgi:hypothetical protein